MNERALLAAQGYLELGMVEEGLAELVSVSEELRVDPDIIELRLHILMQAKHGGGTSQDTTERCSWIHSRGLCPP